MPLMLRLSQPLGRLFKLVPIAILAGLYILFRAFRTWKRSAQDGSLTTSIPDNPDQVDPTQDEYIRRMEEEVRKG